VPNISLDAKLIPRNELDAVIQYSTKWAGAKRINRDFTRLLRTPNEFVRQRFAVMQVTTFFGTLSKGRQPNVVPMTIPGDNYRSYGIDVLSKGKLKPLTSAVLEADGPIEYVSIS
jgi:hypothetical protein